MQLLRERSRTSDLPPADAEVLIQEARHLRRRRWSVGLAVLVLAGLGLAVGLSTTGSAGGGNRLPGAKADSNPPLSVVAIKPGVSMLNLTTVDKYGSIAVAGGRMIVSGPLDSVQDPFQSDTCYSAVVNPSTLKLTQPLKGNCADPALQGREVLPVMTLTKTPFIGPGENLATITIRISHVISGTSGYELGPVVMRFPQASSSWPVFTYGDGDLWLYDDYNPSGVDLLRISEATGQVVQQFSIAKIARPIVAVNDDGFWIAPAVNSTGPAVNSTGPAVYHVALGATSASKVLGLPGPNYVEWMVAADNSVWLDESPGGGSGTLWRLVGNSGTPVSHVPVSSFGNDVEVQGGAAAMVGDASDGLWAVAPTRSGQTQQIVRLNAESGIPSVISTVAPRYLTYDGVQPSWQAVTFGGSMFLLDPPNNSGPHGNQPQGFSALYRITPKAR